MKGRISLLVVAVGVAFAPLLLLGTQRVQPPKIVSRPGYEHHEPVPFTLSSERPTFTHKFSLSKPGPGTVFVRWSPKEARLEATLQPPPQPGATAAPLVRAKEFAPSVLALPFWAESGSLQGWVFNVQYAPSSPKVPVNGEIVVVEGVQPGRKKPLAPSERLAKAMEQMDGENPILPILVHAIERHLQGVSDKSDIDAALEKALRMHPKVTRQMLEQFVRDYKSVPESLRMKITPAALRNLTPSRKLNMSDLAPAIRAATPLPKPTVRPAEAPPTAERGGFLSSALARGFFLPSSDPYIERLEPDSRRTYRAGDRLDIIGNRFSPEKEKNRVHILVDFHGERAALHTLTPVLATSHALQVNLPKDLKPGHYYLQVESKTKPSVSPHLERVPPGVKLPASPVGTTAEEEQWRKSNIVDFYIETPPPPKPEITSVSPEQYPGRSAIVRGKNFVPGRETRIVWEPLDFDTPQGMATETKASVRSATELQFTLPYNILPGRYAVRVHIDGVGFSDSYTYTVKAPKYRVIFTKFRCIDETDPESILGVNEWASDEIVTMWVIVADENMWTKQTGEYGDVDEGEEKDYRAEDRVVFVPGGQAGEVRAVLAVTTTLYEWDAGDAHAAQEFVGVVGHIASAIASAFGPDWLSGVIEAACQAINALVAWFGGNPDRLGRQDLAWTVLELQQRTGSSKMFSGSLDFRGGDYHYRVWYEVHRIED